MALRAHKEAHQATIVNFIQTQDYFIQEHLKGNLEKPAEGQAPAKLMRSYFDSEDCDFQLTPEQKRVADNVNQRVDQALRVREEEDEQEVERLMGVIEEHGSMLAVLGEPGTGKTAVLDACIRRAQRKGARVLLAMPTGVQRARMRARHPDA